MTRAAIYARYSSDNQRDASIEDQLHQCRKKIESEGWAPAEIYSDHAISGASTLRAGYQKMLEDARSGRFDCLVAEALDRLSRDQEDIAGLYKQLTFAEVKIVTLSEGEINELHVGLKGTMNALFLKDLADKTRRGLEGRIRKGKSGGGLCYGYDVVKTVDASGEPVRGDRSINEKEAAVVVRIFEDFASGLSPRKIAQQLNAKRIPGPGGRIWRDTTIRGHATRRTGVLRNDLYDGRLIWNKQHYVKDPSTGRRLARPNPPDDWVVHDLPELRIVDQELWELVQSRLEKIRNSASVRKARAKKFWENRRANHLLTGKVTCAHCGGRFVAVGRDYLACGNARQSDACSSKRSIRRPILENLILDALKNNLMQPDLVKEFTAAFHDEINRQKHDGKAERTRIQRELNRETQRLNGMIDAIADGLRTPGTLARLQQLEKRTAELEARFNSKPAEVLILHPNLAELYRRKLERLSETLRTSTLRHETLDVLRGLIEEVRLKPVKDGFQVELIGDIANIIEIANYSESNKKQTSLDEKTACSVKVVAGVGFEPTTFRL